MIECINHDMKKLTKLIILQNVMFVSLICDERFLFVIIMKRNSKLKM
jgi:hypothetical protein